MGSTAASASREIPLVADDDSIHFERVLPSGFEITHDFSKALTVERELLTYHNFADFWQGTVPSLMSVYGLHRTGGHGDIIGPTPLDLRVFEAKDRFLKKDLEDFYRWQNKTGRAMAALRAYGNMGTFSGLNNAVDFLEEGADLLYTETKAHRITRLVNDADTEVIAACMLADAADSAFDQGKTNKAIELIDYSNAILTEILDANPDWSNPSRRFSARYRIDNQIRRLMMNDKLHTDRVEEIYKAAAHNLLLSLPWIWDQRPQSSCEYGNVRGILAQEWTLLAKNDAALDEFHRTHDRVNFDYFRLARIPREEHSTTLTREDFALFSNEGTVRPQNHNIDIVGQKNTLHSGIQIKSISSSRNRRKNYVPWVHKHFVHDLEPTGADGESPYRIRPFETESLLGLVREGLIMMIKKYGPGLNSEEAARLDFAKTVAFMSDYTPQLRDYLYNGNGHH